MKLLLTTIIAAALLSGCASRANYGPQASPHCGRLQQDQQAVNEQVRRLSELARSIETQQIANRCSFNHQLYKHL